MERVEIEAPFSYLYHLCVSAPGLLVLLLFPMGPTAQNSKGESRKNGECMPGSGFSHRQGREGDLFFK